MMNPEILKFSLNFEHFSLDLHINVEASIADTEGFRPPGIHDFVFAVGEIWLRTADTSRLLIEEINAGNLIIMLEELNKKLLCRLSDLKFERYIFLGEWCQWMNGYWERLHNDRSTKDDDAIYDELIPALISEGKYGYIAVYQYKEFSVLEAGTRAPADADLCFYTKFNPKILSNSLKVLAVQIKDAIQIHLSN